MRTSIVIDDELMAEAMRLSGARTKREVVDLALRTLITRHRQLSILKLKGSGLLDPDYDVRAVRAGMNRFTDWEFESGRLVLDEGDGD